MSILSWIAEMVGWQHRPEGDVRGQEVLALRDDLRRLRADAEMLRAQGLVLRGRVARALTAQPAGGPCRHYSTSPTDPSSFRIAQ